MSAWMLYCVAVAALVGGAASAAERALRSGGDRESRREARWIWATTLGVALLAGALSLTHTPARRAAPAIAPAATHDGRTPARGSAVAAGAAGAAFAGGPAARATTTSSIGRFPSLPSLRAPLVALWVTASALVTLWLAASALRLRHARRGWHRATVDDVAVLVSRDVGPAVVGAFGSEIVLPRWVLELDPARRALIIAHEREHVRARDPLLLAAAHAAVALAPWNPALWWIAAGLRRAVELDCDARVLRTHPDVGGYGALLLDVGRRAARGVVGWHHVPAAAFLHSTSTLERRIRIMTQSRTPRIHALRSLLLAGAALAAAALTPRPPALLAQSATAGSRDSSRASSARGDSGSRSASS
ncbi:MAG TPA: M56 family metallopeptidase, partial [Gemmatimonadaceae bacterium]|nr:M56 family metallopeptidase [Gemmatimonadaceae bacterium]